MIASSISGSSGRPRLTSPEDTTCNLSPIYATVGFDTHSSGKESALYPRTIDNGHGERMTFLGVDHDRLYIESAVDPGAGPPPHIHHLQSETIRVRPGRMGVVIAGEPDIEVGPGEEMTFAAGVEHRFWNAGEDMLLLEG